MSKPQTIVVLHKNNSVHFSFLLLFSMFRSLYHILCYYNTYIIIILAKKKILTSFSLILISTLLRPSKNPTSSSSNKEEKKELTRKTLLEGRGFISQKFHAMP